MNTHEVLTKIFEYCDTHIKELNYGGCGKVFTLIANEMLKRNIRFTIVLIDPKIKKANYPKYGSWGEWEYWNYKEELLDKLKKRSTYLSAAHIFLTYKNRKYNANGDLLTNGIRFKDREQIELLVENLRNSYKVRKIRIWNTDYERKQNNKLRQAIKYYFNKLD